MKTVLGQLRLGGWMSGEELARATGSRIEHVLDVLYDRANKDRVVIARLPNKEMNIIYHYATPECGNATGMGCPIGLTDLPWWLKCSAVEKADRMLKEHMIESGLPDWTRAILAMDKRLFEMGLCGARRRPHDGFHYECAWFVDGCPSPRVIDQYFIGISFTGRAVRNAGWSEDEASDPIIVVQPEKMRCWVTLHRGGGRLLMGGVSSAAVNAETLQLINPPSRKDIIAATKTMLLRSASAEKQVSPFLPIPSARFTLLNAVVRQSTRTGTRQMRSSTRIGQP